MLYIDKDIAKSLGFLNFIYTWKLRYSVSSNYPKDLSNGVYIGTKKAPDNRVRIRNAILIPDSTKQLKEDFFEVKLNNESFQIYADVEEKKSDDYACVVGKVYNKQDEYSYISWDKENNVINLPFDPFSAIENYLYEKYIRHKVTYFNSILFYVAKILPKKFKNLLARMSYFFESRGDAFPSWPYDENLIKLYEFLMQAIAFLTKEKFVEFIWFWPRPYESAFVISFDFDSFESLKNLNNLIALEKKYEFNSTYFFIANFNAYGKWKNRINNLIMDLEKEGDEIASHGLKHDGLLFRTKEIFLHRIRASKEILEKGHRQVEGFRSQHLFRNIDWMDKIAVYYSYDSSYIDTSRRSIYAKRSGCLSVFPFYIGETLEIPITLPLDYQLFIYSGLKYNDCLRIIKKKIKNIMDKNGLLSLLIHPELTSKKEILETYENIFMDLHSRKKIWHTTFLKLFKWWQERRLSVFENFSKSQIERFTYHEKYFI